MRDLLCMRYKALIGLTAALVSICHAVAAENAIPSAWPESRYAELMANSPFALATPAAPPPAAEHNFADGWKLSGLSQIPNAEGVLQNFVVVKSQDGRAKFSLIGPEVSADGVSIVSCEFSALFGKGSVLLKKGSEVAKLEFDPADIAGQPAAAAGAPGIVRPPIPGQQPGVPNFNPGGGGNNNLRPQNIQPHGTPSPGGMPPGMTRANMTNGGGAVGIRPGYNGGPTPPTGPNPVNNRESRGRQRVRVIPNAPQ